MIHRFMWCNLLDESDHIDRFTDGVFKFMDVSSLETLGHMHKTVLSQFVANGHVFYMHLDTNQVQQGFMNMPPGDELLINAFHTSAVDMSCQIGQAFGLLRATIVEMVCIKVEYVS